MPFIQCIRFHEPKPTVLYFHETGYADAFGKDRVGIPEGLKHTVSILERHPQLTGSATYILAALWGDKGRKTAELFGYGDLSEWHCNPTAYDPLVFKDGVYQPLSMEVGCGDMAIAFGREEEHRRACKDIDEFIARQPELPGFLWSQSSDVVRI